MIGKITTGSNFNRLFGYLLKDDKEAQIIGGDQRSWHCVIASITRESSLQQRVRLDPVTVQEYCEILRQGEKLDPVN